MKKLFLAAAFLGLISTGCRKIEVDGTSYIEGNLANSDFDVERLCHDLLLSSSQVHRKLTALTGLSTNSFIRYIRLSNAKNLLITNAHFSIAAVAYDSGFCDPAYFSRAFKQEFGETPQAWREQNLV